MSTENSPKLRTAFRFLLIEGSFAMIHDTWTGPTYLSGLVGELHAPVIWVSLLCSAAWIGAVGQLLGAWVYERTSSYKVYTLRLATLSRALWLVPMGLAAGWTYRSKHGGAPFPVDLWCGITAAVACCAALFGSSSSAAWNSWVRALVPPSALGRFFGRRQSVVMFALIGANLVAAVSVDWRPSGMYAGFALLGALSITAAGVSTWLLSRVMDAGTPSGEGPSGAKEFVSWVREPLRDPGFRGIVLYGALFNGAMQLAGPYFPYYFTHELGIPMSQVASWAALTNLGCVLAAGAWGRYLDGGKNRPRLVMRAMGTLVAFSPLFYLSSSATWVRVIAPWDYLSNGVVWIGYWLALTTMLYRSIPSNVSPALCFSIYAAAAGLCGALGSLMGGWLAHTFEAWGGFQALWLTASVLRLSVLWGLYGRLKIENDVSASWTSDSPAAQLRSPDLLENTPLHASSSASDF